MKKCIKCDSSSNGFRKEKKNVDGLDNYCKVCRREMDKQTYNNHIDKNRKIGYNAKQKVRKRNQEFIIQYLLSHPCIICGENDIVVLEFDHTNNKICNISELIMNSSIKRIEEEIDKYQVLCANCHRRKTAKDLKYYRMLGGGNLENTPDSLSGADIGNT